MDPGKDNAPAEEPLTKIYSLSDLGVSPNKSFT